MMLRSVLILIGLCFFSATQACARLILPARVTVQISSLDALYHENEFIERFELAVRAFNQDCRFALGAQSFTQQQAGVHFALRTSAQGGELGVSTAAGRTQVDGSINANSSLRVSLYTVLGLSRNQLPQSGSHLFTVPLVLFAREGATSRVVDETILNVEVRVPAVVNLSINGGKRAEVSLGDLRRGGEVSVPIEIEANHAVSLQVISMRHGYLRHQHLPSERIPYQAWLGGDSLDLAGGSHVVRVSLGDAGHYKTYMRFFASEQNLAIAGEYSDVLLMTIVAR